VRTIVSRWIDIPCPYLLGTALLVNSTLNLLVVSPPSAATPPPRGTPE
jgi:hypothetical protein